MEAHNQTSQAQSALLGISILHTNMKKVMNNYERMVNASIHGVFKRRLSEARTLTKSCVWKRTNGALLGVENFTSNAKYRAFCSEARFCGLREIVCSFGVGTLCPVALMLAPGSRRDSLVGSTRRGLRALSRKWMRSSALAGRRFCICRKSDALSIFFCAVSIVERKSSGMVSL